MTIDITALEEIGLTSSQIKVYIALLELGETTSGPILKKSKLHNSVVYNALNRLTEQGLVSFVKKGKIKYFSITDPKNILKYIDDKREKIREIIPKFVAKQKLAKSKQEAEVFLGWKGVYAAFNKILEGLPKGGEYIGFGAGFEDQYTEEAKKFFREYQKKRSLMKLKIRIVANETAREQIKKYGWYPNFGKPDYRYVNGFAPIGVIIFGDNTLNVAFSDNPVAVIITSKEITDSYRRCFEKMWEVGRK